MRAASETPRFRTLTRRECESLLRRNSVGRVAFVHGQRIDIVPINYVFSRGVISGRTARGTRLDTASINLNDAWPVAFEADEVRALFEWRSVVVHGNLHAAVRDDAEWMRNRRDWERAVRAIRKLIPEVFTNADPTRFRDVVIRIDIAEVSGREAMPPPAPRAHR